MGKRRHIAQDPWNAATRQAFADGNRTKAQTFAERKKEANRQACRKWKWEK